MKKIILSIFTIFTLSLSILAQAPEGFKYQAVVRGAANAILANQSVGMQLTILQGSPTGTAIYTETFATTTNAYGLVNLEIGTGTTSNTFSTINWANGPYFIETAVDLTGGTNYSVMGTSQLMSVPYALHSKTADSVLVDMVDDADNDPTNEIQALSINADTVFLSNGGFVKLPSGFNGDFNSLSNVPVNLDTDSTDDFDGNYTSLVGAPTLVSAFTNDAGYLTSFTEIDGDSTNEIQTISISTDTLFLTKGGFAKLPTGGSTGANWTLNGNNISNTNSGYVGIGTTNPLFNLSILDTNAKIALGNGGSFNSVNSGKLIFQEDILYNGFCGFEFNHNGASNDLMLLAGCSTPDTIFRANRNGNMNINRLRVSSNLSQNSIPYDLTVEGTSGFTGNVTITGNLNVTGSISKGSGTFRIDHPLDPANKYLVHSFVESPEMMNIYSGNVVTNGSGFATVTLPSYFEAANKDFRYQLTVIGTFADAIIKEKISNNRFVIQTNEPNVEVSWSVTAVRADKYANKYRVQVEEEKETKGTYIHPELYNESEEQSVNRQKEKLLIESINSNSNTDKD